MKDRGADPISPEDRAEPIVVVPYDPVWPATFEALREPIARALAGLAAGIEHVGSTAVPGLAAKPIIDIDVVIRTADDMDATVQHLAGLGYAHLGDLGIRGRDAFRAPPGLPRHHLYVCAAGSAALLAHLAFRDALRRDTRLADAYTAVKRELARRFRDDRDSYAEGKTAFVTSVLLDQRAGPRRARRAK
jgi:GrpB-like predicted nucleotidyltransferase (UPF0157 family)